MSTELFDALEQHDLNRLATLLAGGADPNTDHPQQPSWVPLKAAIEEIAEGGSVEAVRLLLRYDAEVDGGRQPGGATPLIVAALNSQFEATRILLEAGADPHRRDDEGDTALSLSVGNDDERTAALLRLYGATE